MAVVGCGLTEGGPDSPGGKRGTDAACEPVDALSEAALEALCRTQCLELIPAMVCNGVELCVQTCVAGLSGTDESCAQCGAATYHDYGYCSTFECVCPAEGGRVDIWTTNCREACAAVHELDRCEYRTAPRPEPSGPAPLHAVELEGFPVVADVAVDEEGAIWVAGYTQPLHGALRVARFSAEFELLWSWQHEHARRHRGGEIVVIGTRVFVVTSEVEPGRSYSLAAAIHRFDARGYVGTTSAPFESADDPMAGRLGDSVAVSSPGRDTVAVGPDGTLSAPLPPTAFFDVPEYFHVGIDAEGVWTLGAVTESALWWRRYDVAFDPALTITPLGPPRNAQFDTSKRLERFGVDARGVPYAMATSRGDSIYYDIPWLVRLRPEGGQAWIWSGSAGRIPGLTAHVAFDPLGAAAIASQEALPESEGDPHCAPSGCKVLTVHRLSADGIVEWSYRHRSEASNGAAVALAPDGDIIVAGEILPNERLSDDTRRGVLMRFAPLG